MYNLIKSEVYKLRYGKTYKGLFILSICCVVMTIVSAANKTNFQIMQTYFNNRNYGFAIGSFFDTNNIKGVEFFASGLGWTPILVVGLMYLISMFTCDEYMYGTYKNVLSYGNKRRDVYISKLLAISIGISMLVFAVPMASLIIGTIIYGWGVDFKIEQIIEMVKLLSVNTLIFASIASTFMFVATIIKNKALLVTIGTVASISPAFIMDKIPLKILENYPIFMLMDTCSKMPDKQFIIKIIIVCSIITIVFLVMGIYTFKNQDIK